MTALALTPVDPRTTPSTCDGGRALLLVDLENLLGCDPNLAPDRAWTMAAADVLAAAGGEATNDLVVVAVSPARAFLARTALPGALLRCRRGVDGADRALIDDIADTDWILNRFARVVIASGDGIFTDHAAYLGAAGMRVDHVAQHGQCSVRLRLAVHRTLWLPNYHWTAATSPDMAPADPVPSVVAISAARVGPDRRRHAAPTSTTD